MTFCVITEGILIVHSFLRQHTEVTQCYLMNTDLSVYASENLCYRPTSIFFLKHYIAFQIAQEQKQFRNWEDRVEDTC